MPEKNRPEESQMQEWLNNLRHLGKTSNDAKSRLEELWAVAWALHPDEEVASTLLYQSIDRLHALHEGLGDKEKQRLEKSLPLWSLYQFSLALELKQLGEPLRSISEHLLTPDVLLIRYIKLFGGLPVLS